MAPDASGGRLVPLGLPPHTHTHTHAALGISYLGHFFLADVAAPSLFQQELKRKKKKGLKEEALDKKCISA